MSSESDAGHTLKPLAAGMDRKERQQREEDELMRMQEEFFKSKQSASAKVVRMSSAESHGGSAPRASKFKQSKATGVSGRATEGQQQQQQRNVHVHKRDVIALPSLSPAGPSASPVSSHGLTRPLPSSSYPQKFYIDPARDLDSSTSRGGNAPLVAANRLPRIIEKQPHTFTPKPGQAPLVQPAPASGFPEVQMLNLGDHPAPANAASQTPQKQSIFATQFDAISAERQAAVRVRAQESHEADSAASKESAPRPVTVERDIIQLPSLEFAVLPSPKTAAEESPRTGPKSVSEKTEPARADSPSHAKRASLSETQPRTQTDAEDSDEDGTTGVGDGSSVDFLAPLADEEREKIRRENDSKIAAMSQAEILEMQAQLRKQLDPSLIDLLAHKRRRTEAPAAGPSAKAHATKPRTDTSTNSNSNSTNDTNSTNSSLPVPESKSSPGDPLGDDEKEQAERALCELLNGEQRKKWIHMDVVERDKLAWITESLDASASAPPAPPSPPTKQQALALSSNAAGSSPSNASPSVPVLTMSSSGTFTMSQPESGESGKPSTDLHETSSGRKVRFDFRGLVVPLDADFPVSSGLYHHGEDSQSPGYTLGELLTLSRSAVPYQRVFALKMFARIARNAWLGKFVASIHTSVLEVLLNGIALPVVVRYALDDTHESVIAAAVECLAGFVCPGIRVLEEELTAADLLGSTPAQEQLPAKAKHIRSLLTNPTNEEQFLCDTFLLSHRGGEVPNFKPPSGLEVSSVPETGGGDGGAKGNRNNEDEDEDEDDENRALDDREKSQKDVVLALVEMQLLERLRYLLEVCQIAGTADLILAILIRIARHSAAASRRIVQTPRLVQCILSLFIQSPSPVERDDRSATGLERVNYAEPKHLAIRLFRVLCQMDRSNAAALAKTDVFASVIRFVLQSPIDEIDESIAAATHTPSSPDIWSRLLNSSAAPAAVLTASEFTLVEARFALAVETLQLWSVLVSYGLFCEPLKDLFGILTEQLLAFARIPLSTLTDPQRASALSTELKMCFGWLQQWSISLINLLSALVVVAADPKQSTPVHSLHWSHVAGFFDSMVLVHDKASALWAAQLTTHFHSLATPFSPAQILLLHGRPHVSLGVRLVAACYRFFGTFILGLCSQVVSERDRAKVSQFVSREILPKLSSPTSHVGLGFVLGNCPSTLARDVVKHAQVVASSRSPDSAEDFQAAESAVSEALSLLFDATTTLAALPALPIREKFCFWDDMVELALAQTRLIQSCHAFEPNSIQAFQLVLTSPTVDTFIAAYSEASRQSLMQKTLQVADLSPAADAAVGVTDFSWFVVRRQQYLAFSVLECLRKYVDCKAALASTSQQDHDDSDDDDDDGDDDDSNNGVGHGQQARNTAGSGTAASATANFTSLEEWLFQLRLKQQRLALCILERLGPGDESIAKSIIETSVAAPLTRDVRQSSHAKSLFYTFGGVQNPPLLTRYGWGLENALRNGASTTLSGALTFMLATHGKSLKQSQARQVPLPSRLLSLMIPKYVRSLKGAKTSGAAALDEQPLPDVVASRFYPCQPYWPFGPIEMLHTDLFRLTKAMRKRVHGETGAGDASAKTDVDAEFEAEKRTALAVAQMAVEFLCLMEIWHSQHFDQTANVSFATKVSRLMMLFFVEGELYREAAVAARVECLLSRYCQTAGLAASNIPKVKSLSPWEVAAEPASFLFPFNRSTRVLQPAATATARTAASTLIDLDSAQNVHFVELYQELLHQFLSASFGDEIFGKVLLMGQLACVANPLYRKLAWTEHSELLRILRLSPKELPFPPEFLLYPLEMDVLTLEAYASALVSLRARKEWSALLYGVGVHHVCAFVFSESIWESTQSALSTPPSSAGKDTGGASGLELAAAKRSSILYALLTCSSADLVRDFLCYQPDWSFAPQPLGSRVRSMLEAKRTLALSAVACNPQVLELLGEGVD